MSVRIPIDEKLVAEARRLGRHRSRKAAVVAALKEYIARRRQTEIISAFGSFDFDPDYDYKSERFRSKY